MSFAKIFHSPQHLVSPSQLLTLPVSRYLVQPSHYLLPFRCNVNPYYRHIIVEGHFSYPIPKMIARQISTKPITFSHAYMNSNSHIIPTQPSSFTSYDVFLDGRWHVNGIQLSSKDVSFDWHCLLFPIDKNDADKLNL
jgi:hypothetical protein